MNQEASNQGANMFREEVREILRRKKYAVISEDYQSAFEINEWLYEIISPHYHEKIQERKQIEKGLAYRIFGFGKSRLRTIKHEARWDLMRLVDCDIDRAHLSSLVPDNNYKEDK